MLRVATFNIENLDDGPEVEPPLGERISVLAPQIERLDADVLCLQEVNAQKPDKRGPRLLLALDRLLEGTRYADFHRACTDRHDRKGMEDKGFVDRHNLVILSRYPITRWNQHRHSLVTPPAWSPTTALPPLDEPFEIEFDRAALEAEIALPDGRTLHLFNLHLRAPIAASIPGQKASAGVWRSIAGWAEGYYMAAMKRGGQALEVRRLIEGIHDAHDAPLILVCGDLNAEANEVPYRILRAAVEDTGNPDLGRRVLLPVETRVEQARRYSVIHKGRAQMLDHMLVSPALAETVSAVEIDNAGLPDEWADHVDGRSRRGSHHAPLVATFSL